jgi:hypothetical protein
VIADYFSSIERLLNNSALIVEKKLDFKEFSSEEGMVRGSLLFLGGYVLNFMEYIQIGKERPKYSFNFTDGKSVMIFRYDNAPHHREIPTFPHHKHFRSNIQPSKEMGLAEVLSEIEKIILTGK